MVRIAVNPRSLDWQAVIVYIRARRAELVEEAVDLSRSDQERRDAAARIAELDQLASAPEDTMAAVEGEIRGREQRRSVY